MVRPRDAIFQLRQDERADIGAALPQEAFCQGPRALVPARFVEVNAGHVYHGLTNEALRLRSQRHPAAISGEDHDPSRTDEGQRRLQRGLGVRHQVQDVHEEQRVECGCAKGRVRRPRRG